MIEIHVFLIRLIIQLLRLRERIRLRLKRLFPRPISFFVPLFPTCFSESERKIIRFIFPRVHTHGCDDASLLKLLIAAAAQEKYRQKQERDNLRYSLENNSLAMEECDIYYYEDAAGESNKVMTLLKPQGVTVYASIAKNSALMYAYNMDLEQIGKTRLSDLAEVEYYEIQQEIEKQLGDGGQLLYIESGVVHEIEDYEGGSEYLGY